MARRRRAQWRKWRAAPLSERGTVPLWIGTRRRPGCARRDAPAGWHGGANGPAARRRSRARPVFGTGAPRGRTARVGRDGGEARRSGRCGPGGGAGRPARVERMCSSPRPSRIDQSSQTRSPAGAGSGAGLRRRAMNRRRTHLGPRRVIPARRGLTTMIERPTVRVHDGGGGRFAVGDARASPSVTSSRAVSIAPRTSSRSERLFCRRSVIEGNMCSQGYGSGRTEKNPRCGIRTPVFADSAA